MVLRVCIAACVLLVADAALRTAKSLIEDNDPQLLVTSEDPSAASRGAMSALPSLLRLSASPQKPAPDVTLNPVAEVEDALPSGYPRQPLGAEPPTQPDLATVSDSGMAKNNPVATGELAFWPPTQGNGLLAWVCAALFVLLIAAIPLILQASRQVSKASIFVIMEGVVLLVWLIGGLYMFTHLVEFKSPHFGGQVRTLTLVEAVYVFAQIITTVGYGDVVPAHLPGQLFLGAFVFCAILFIAAMVSELSALVVERAEKRLESSIKTNEENDDKQSASWTKGVPLVPLIASSALFLIFVVAGMAFYHLYPGENKTWGQGLYMSIITLTTVGFGVLTPSTEVGMVFGTFWMVFGVAVLGGVITSFTEVRLAMKKISEDQETQIDAQDASLKEYLNKDGQLDQCGYLCYALHKKDLLKSPLRREQLEAIMKQFEALDSDKTGSVNVQSLPSTSA